MSRPSPDRVLDILNFWFAPEMDARWFASDPALDAEIEARYAADMEKAAAGRFGDWQDSSDGALALVILLDQFPRNVFRDSPRAFATDTMARSAAADAVAKKFDLLQPVRRRTFFYLPFEHSEDLVDQKRAVALFEAAGDALSLDWARRRLVLIEQFGRFPHRNAILGRENTPREAEFLSQPGAGF